MGWTAGDVEIHWDFCAFAPTALFRLLVIGAAADGTGTHGDHQFGIGGCFERFAGGQCHVLGDGAADKHGVGVARACHDLDPEAAQIPPDGGEHVDIHLAAVAATR